MMTLEQTYPTDVKDSVDVQDGGPPPSPREPAKSPRARRRWWLWLLVCGLMSVAASVLYSRFGQSQLQSSRPAATPGSRTVPVVATAARQGDLGIYLTGLGTVTAFNTVAVRTRVDGQLVKVAFQEGQWVRQGDLLAEIDPRPFQVQLTQAEGQMARDQALLKNAKIDLARYTILLAEDSIPKQQLDTQVALVNQYEGTVKSDQGQIDSAKLQLVYSRITAPISGRIGLRLVDQGNMVHATDPNGLALITQLQPIAVLFTIPAVHLPAVFAKMRSGQPLVVDLYNRDLQRKLATGTLLAIDNQIDPNTGTLRCKAVFPNEDNALFPNQFVNAWLLVDIKQGVIIVPTAAIQRSPQATFVYVVTDDSTVEARNVVVGPVEGDEASVDSGLSPGEVVVAEGVDKLQHGTKVAVHMAGVRTAMGNGQAQHPPSTTDPPPPPPRRAPQPHLPDRLPDTAPLIKILKGECSPATSATESGSPAPPQSPEPRPRATECVLHILRGEACGRP
jgi:multidrug efflux system membrane fusion protein